MLAGSPPGLLVLRVHPGVERKKWGMGFLNYNSQQALRGGEGRPQREPSLESRPGTQPLG